MFQKIKYLVMRASRRKKLGQFYQECGDACSVLNAGVSPETSDENLARNVFLKGFRFQPEYYTGLGIQDLSMMGKIYPGKKFHIYDGGTFPFKDNEFEMVWSNAVIEHVGLRDKQILFINEMLRVSKKIFFTTPNKYFPIETHTNVLFLHYSDKYFVRYMNDRTHYSKETLNLLSSTQLQKLLEESNAIKFRIIRNRFFGMTMTFSVIGT